VTLGNPTLTSELKERLAAGITAETAGRGIAELAAWLNRFLVRPHPGAAVLPVEGWILAVIGIDHTLGSARLRLSLSPRWARSLAWSGLGALFALRRPR